MQETGRIENAELLSDVFGYWPSFHDAEVHWLRLDRHAQRVGSFGPMLETLIHTFEITDEVGPDRHYILRHHVLVHFRFHEVTELRLEEFNYQNALWGMTFTSLADRQMERVKWAVRFVSSFGMDASFQCHDVELVSIAPCSTAGEPLHTESGPD